MFNIRKLTIIPGTNCNFACKHCLVSLKFKDLDEKEIFKLSKFIQSHSYRTILFVGGETILYLKTLNKILGLIDCSTKKIRITTNGYFAESVSSAKKRLTSIKRLDGVQLSYDIFHKEFLPLTKVKNLYNACQSLKIDFSVIMTISSPPELRLVKELRKIGNFKIAIQKVSPTGNALKNNVYFKESMFNKKVLYKKCNSVKSGELLYVPQLGFSPCCSNLLYNKKLNKFITFKNPNNLFRSDFYKLMIKNNFKEIAKKMGVDTKKITDPLFSNECFLCEYIFQKGHINGRNKNPL